MPFILLCVVITTGHLQRRCRLCSSVWCLVVFCYVPGSQEKVHREGAICMQVHNVLFCFVVCQDHVQIAYGEDTPWVQLFHAWLCSVACQNYKQIVCGEDTPCVQVFMFGCVPFCVRIASRWRMEKIPLVFKCLMHDCVSLHVRITGRWRMEKIPLVFKCLMLGCVPLCARITSGHMRRRPHLCARCAARGSRAAATCTAMSSTDTRMRRNTAVTGVTAPLKPGNQQQSCELAQPHPHPHLHPHHLWHLHHRSPHCDQQQHWFCEQIRTRGVGCWYYEIGDIDGIFKDTNNDDLDSNNGSDSNYDNDWSKGLALTLLSQSLQGMAG